VDLEDCIRRVAADLRRLTSGCVSVEAVRVRRGGLVEPHDGADLDAVDPTWHAALDDGALAAVTTTDEVPPRLAGRGARAALVLAARLPSSDLVLHVLYLQTAIAPEAADRLLPLALAARAAMAAFDGAGVPDLAASRPLRILIAEDNPINQKVARAMLRRLGYQPDVAANGLEALRAVARQRYDVVLMDVQMPEMDGLTAARELRGRYPDDERPRLVAMTASALQEDREACLAAGMDDYLAKPLTVAKLIELLRRL
jgi:CheY-like chemotaxis protein